MPLVPWAWGRQPNSNEVTFRRLSGWPWQGLASTTITRADGSVTRAGSVSLDRVAPGLIVPLAPLWSRFAAGVLFWAAAAYIVIRLVIVARQVYRGERDLRTLAPRMPRLEWLRQFLARVRSQTVNRPVLVIVCLLVGAALNFAIPALLVLNFYKGPYGSVGAWVREEHFNVYSEAHSRHDPGAKSAYSLGYSVQHIPGEFYLGHVMRWDRTYRWGWPARSVYRQQIDSEHREVLAIAGVAFPGRVIWIGFAANTVFFAFILWFPIAGVPECRRCGVGVVSAAVSAWPAGTIFRTSTGPAPSAEPHHEAQSDRSSLPSRRRCGVRHGRIASGSSSLISQHVRSVRL